MIISSVRGIRFIFSRLRIVSRAVVGDFRIGVGEIERDVGRVGGMKKFEGWFVRCPVPGTRKTIKEKSI